MFALLGLVVGCLVGALFTFLTFHVAVFIAGPRAAHDAALVSGPVWALIFGWLGLSVGYKKNPDERVVQEQVLRLRLVDTLHWWVTHGERLFRDPAYMENHVRVNGPRMLGEKDKIIGLYHDPTDPCTTMAGARSFAKWAVKHQAEMLADDLPRESDRTIEGLTLILRYHRQRDILVLREAESAMLAYQAESTPRLTHEPIESVWKRTISDHASLIAFRAQARKDVQAGSYTEEEKQELFSLADELVRADIRRRIGAQA